MNNSPFSYEAEEMHAMAAEQAEREEIQRDVNAMDGADAMSEEAFIGAMASGWEFAR